MTNKILLSIVLTIFALSSGSAYAAGSANKVQGQNNNSSSTQQNGIHEPGTGIENPELKEENRGTGQGFQNSFASSTDQRSSVAEFVENLLKIANKNGIGEQVRVIAQELNRSASTSIQKMEKIQTRSKIKTFLVGSDYKNLGELRSEIVQNRNRIEQINNIINNVKNTVDQTNLQNEIKSIEEEQNKINDFIKNQEGKISLFGWLNKLINKE